MASSGPQQRGVRQSPTRAPHERPEKYHTGYRAVGDRIDRMAIFHRDAADGAAEAGAVAQAAADPGSAAAGRAAYGPGAAGHRATPARPVRRDDAGGTKGPRGGAGRDR